MTVREQQQAQSAERWERLAARVRRLRTRAAAGNLDRWLLVAGGFLTPLGIFAIMLGWLGAANTPVIFEQTPYLISGGLLGVALVFLGGLVYFAYWQSMLVRQGRRQHGELIAQQRQLAATAARIEALLAGDGRGGHGNGHGRLVATTEGTMLHRRDCAVVAGRDDVRGVSSDTPGLEPCALCNPLATTRDD